MGTEIIMLYGLPEIGSNKNVEIESQGREGTHRQIIRLNLEIPPKSSIKVTLVIRQSHDEKVDGNYVTKFPMINGFLVANFPDNYCFGVFATMSSKLVLEMNEENRQMYEMHGAALPGQGFTYFLTKRDART